MTDLSPVKIKLNLTNFYFISVSRNRLRDSRGGAEGVARAAHGHEDAPQLPVRVQTGREQAAGILKHF